MVSDALDTSGNGQYRHCIVSGSVEGCVWQVWVAIADLYPLGSPAAQSPTAADPLQQAYAGVQQYAGR